MKRRRRSACALAKNRKTWIVLKEPNRTKLRLGHCPDLSLAEARKKALVAIGTPFDVRVKVPSFPEARQQYLDQGNWRPRSRYQVTRNLMRHSLGRRRSTRSRRAKSPLCVRNGFEAMLMLSYSRLRLRRTGGSTFCRSVRWPARSFQVSSTRDCFSRRGVRKRRSADLRPARSPSTRNAGSSRGGCMICDEPSQQTSQRSGRRST